MGFLGCFFFVLQEDSFVIFCYSLPFIADCTICLFVLQPFQSGVIRKARCECCPEGDTGLTCGSTTTRAPPPPPPLLRSSSIVASRRASRSRAALIHASCVSTLFRSSSASTPAWCTSASSRSRAAAAASSRRASASSMSRAASACAGSSPRWSPHSAAVSSPACTSGASAASAPRSAARMRALAASSHDGARCPFSGGSDGSNSSIRRSAYIAAFSCSSILARRSSVAPRCTSSSAWYSVITASLASLKCRARTTSPSATTTSLPSYSTEPAFRWNSAMMMALSILLAQCVSSLLSGAYPSCFHWSCTTCTLLTTSQSHFIACSKIYPTSVLHLNCGRCGTYRYVAPRRAASTRVRSGSGSREATKVYRWSSSPMGIVSCPLSGNGLNAPPPSTA
eukprot:Rhum_TRINITY_DN25313_c0_g1::Rhum_TRINITY_DN25313_c0_g1_i1::g.181809::m.181809